MRSRTAIRYVQHTVDGETELIPEKYKIPGSPLDWDRIALTAVTTTTAAIVLASVGWSTAGIGDLLDLVAPSVAAYSAASVFDLLWINCMILEWVFRYDPERAAVFRRAGHTGLAIAMAAICLHGYLAESLKVGIVAAAVSALAKAAWTLVMRAHARPLDARTQQWLVRRQAKIFARLALSAQLRHLAAIEARAAGHTLPDHTPEPPEGRVEAPEDGRQLLMSGPMTMADAVRTAVSCNITDPDAVVRYVRKVHDANAKEESVLRTLRMARKAS
ncbi:protein transporter Sec31 [Streptomyces sp. NPDC093801]|uniref:protein transporter Sec31 n=1 Tax=Streptomyces sp. NPDC093801 TaxID=3155203 RepID=UPI00344FA062